MKPLYIKATEAMMRLGARDFHPNSRGARRTQVIDKSSMRLWKCVQVKMPKSAKRKAKR